MPAKFLTRVVPAAVVAAGLLIASPVAEAKEKPVVAKIALGDKRSKKVKATAKKRARKKRAKAKTSQLAPCQNTGVMPTPETVDVVREAILCLHNEIRAEHDLPALKDNSRLSKAADGHSYDMVNEGFFDHTGPDGSSFVDRIIGARYAKRDDGWTLGENIAWGTGDLSTPAGIMNAWMNSSGHKANILKRGFEEVGIGIRLGVPSDEGVGATVTADFGTKL